MPILAVNQFGQIYETSPDREDGRGFGSSPECVAQGDLTLGSAYVKTQARRQQELIKRHRDQRALDAHDEMTRRIAAADLKQRRQHQAAEVRLSRNPQVKAAIMKKALGEDCSCEYSTPMSGNVMTANGQYGWNGLNRDQQVIHHVTMGQGANVAHRVNPSEAKQFQEKINAERLLRLRARR